MLVSDKDYLPKCKSIIEENLKWGSSNDWKQRDFENLSELIFQKTQILLSLSTLKRIWKSHSDTVPHPNTLNALAEFAGFKNWLDLKLILADNRDLVEENHQQVESIKSSRKKKILLTKFKPGKIFVWGSLGLILMFIFLFFIEGENPDYSDVIFKSKKVVTAGLPNTVVFDYDISNIESDSLFIQQSWDRRRKALISKEDNQYTSVYYFPGYHRAKLIVDNEIVKEHNIHITTNDWLTIARYKLDDEIPIYITEGNVYSNRTIHATPETLELNKVNIKDLDYLVSYYNVRDFGEVRGDDFSISTRVKNPINEGGLTCQYAVLYIMCENTRHSITLSNAGCVSNIGIKFGDTVISGKTKDLSIFGCDLSIWNELRCEVENKNVEIFLNEESIYQLAFTLAPGKIIGLHIMFYGSGSIDFVQLQNKQGKIIYFDDFTK